MAACYRNIERQNPSFTVTLLNRDNIADFVPEYHTWPSDMLPQHKANLLRLYLVFRYGGIWLDSSIILGESLEWVIQWQQEQRLGFVGFHNDRISRRRDEPTIENWFLAAPAGNEFLGAWIEHLAVQAVHGAPACYRSLMRRAEVRRAAERVPNPRLRVAYLACAAALHDCEDIRMGLVRVRDEAFAIVEERSKTDRDIAINWLLRPAPSDRHPALSKLTQKDRGIVEAYLARGLYQPSSLIGQVIEGC
ncbi:capsular polysaccharide synthesis protein [Salinisphaera sp. SPP-AMP-43]|uniref:capsular polysaccharide synthesis protein n=1 Tax=Salinisphaera sp. SPP-AMP-43 TaxID=3121288 RepID=UPI003C6DD092